MTKKEKTLEALRNDSAIGVESVQKWMKEGTLSLSEVMNAAPADSEIGRWIRTQVEEIEKEQWNKVVSADDDWNGLKLLSGYLEQFPEEGSHTDEAKSRKIKLEGSLWEKVMEEVKDRDISTDDVMSHLRLFKKEYPDSQHKQECDDWLADEQWIKTIKTHTIDAFKSYIETFQKHKKEAGAEIEDIQDDIDWENAKKNDKNGGSREVAISAYEEYLSKHSTEKNEKLVREGKYVEEAKKRIDELKKPSGPKSPEETLFDELKKDINKYNPRELQEMVSNHVTEWDHLVDAQIFDKEECDAIKDWNNPYPLKFPDAPDKLTEGTTEAYFWGTPATGKTCAMGAVLSAAKKIEKNLIVNSCSGMKYADDLSKMLTTGKVALLPYSNPDDKPSVSEMYCNFSRKEVIPFLFWKKEMEVEHEISIVDVAGEVFTSMYMSMDPGLANQLKPSDTKLLEIIEKFMVTKGKDKIHFFVIEYGAGGKEVRTGRLDPRPTQDDILSKGLEYIKKHKILNNSVSVNVLVTKSDLAQVPYGKTRDEVVKDFVKNEYGAFWNQLNKATEAANIRNHNRDSFEPEIIPFSIGKVFAQNLCRFEYDEGTKEVMKVILEKTYGTWSKLLIFLRS